MLFCIFSNLPGSAFGYGVAEKTGVGWLLGNALEKFSKNSPKTWVFGTCSNRPHLLLQSVTRPRTRQDAEAPIKDKLR